MDKRQEKVIKNFSVTKWLSYVCWSICIGFAMLLIGMDIELTSVDGMVRGAIIAGHIILLFGVAGYILDDPRRVLRIVRPILIVIGAWLYKVLPFSLNRKFVKCNSIKARCHNSYRYTYHRCKELHDEAYGFPGELD